MPETPEHEQPDHEELLGLLDRLAEATVLVDRDWRVRYGNAAAARWVDAPGPVHSQRLWELLPALRDSAFHRTYQEAMETGEPGRVEAFAPSLDAWFEAEAHPTAGGLTIVFRDRTAHRREELARELLSGVAAAAENGDGTIGALAGIAGTLREMTGYEVGKVWLRDHLGAERLVACDHAERPGLAAFAEAVRRTGLSPDSLPARALETGEPVTVHDLPGASDPARAAAAEAAGLRAGVYLPLQWPDGLAAVIGLLTHRGPGHDDWCTVLTQAHPRLARYAGRMRTRQELSRLFDLAREGLTITGADGWFHRVNPEATRMLGRDADELLSRPYLDVVHPDDRRDVAAAAERLLAGGAPQPFEYRVLLPSGEERVLAAASRAAPEEGLIYSAVRDVTSERRRERFEADQRSLLRAIALGAPLEETLHQLVAAAETWLPGARGSVWLVERESDTLRVASAPSVPERYLAEVGRLPIDSDQTASAQALATGRTVVIEDIRSDPRTAAYREAAAAHGLPACWAAPFHGAQGEPLGVFVLYPARATAPDGQELHALEDAARLAGVAVARDRAQTALTESEERFRLLAEAATDAMWDRDLDEDVLWFNEGFARHFGYDPREVASALQLWVSNIHEEDRGAVLDSIDAALASGQRRWEREYRFFRGDGTEATVLDRGSIVRDQRGRAVRLVGGMWDLTAHREREEARQRARRLEELGTLAGGMAHDLNNVLAPILLSADMLGSRELDETTRRLVDRIEGSARRGSKMIEQVLALARGTEGERAAVGTAELVTEVVEHARHTFDPAVAVRCELPAEVPPVLGDATQLHQVLLNLVVNARDAMPEGGTVTVRAHEHCPGSAEGEQTDRVRLQVADTGIGMDEEVRGRLGQPFFTTKGQGRGTGLGLATAMAVVDSHGGSLHVASRPGEGTTVTVDLPTADPG